MKKLISKSILLLSSFLALTACEKYTKLSIEEARTTFRFMYPTVSDYDRLDMPDQFVAEFSNKEYFECLIGDQKVVAIDDTLITSAEYDKDECYGHFVYSHEYLDVTKKTLNTEYWLYKDGGNVILARKLNGARSHFKTSATLSAVKDLEKTFLSLNASFNFSDVVYLFCESFFAYTEPSIIENLKSEENRKTDIVFKTKGNGHLKLNFKTSLKEHDFKSSYSEVYEIENNFPVYNKTVIHDEGNVFEMDYEETVYGTRNTNRYWNLDVVAPKKVSKPDLSSSIEVEDVEDLIISMEVEENE